jgi:hypothetical protein
MMMILWEEKHANDNATRQMEVRTNQWRDVFHSGELEIAKN